MGRDDLLATVRLSGMIDSLLGLESVMMMVILGLCSGLDWCSLVEDLRCAR